MRTLLAFFFATFVFLRFMPLTFAAGEFTTTMTATYTVNEQGNTHVVHDISIKNNFSSIFVTQYALEVGSSVLKNIEVKTQKGDVLPVNTTATAAKTSIALTFPDKVIGKDQERVFTISYDNPEIAVVAGAILEVNIPKLVKPEEFAAYTVRLQVPSTFGDPAIATPTVIFKEESGTTTAFGFAARSAENGIHAIFGTQQTFRFQLKYHLNNPSISQGVSQIALPPDTAFQKVRYESIEPKPDSIAKDEDGNWIATFTVGSQKELTVQANGYASIFLNPVERFPQPKQDRRYLEARPYWDVTDPEIQKLAKELKTPQAIYAYVTTALTYNYDRLNQSVQTRQGGAQALRMPTNALCEEFTDVFISIARAAGIPAREINGFAYTSNPRLRPLSLVADVLHAWPEYYDSERKLWIPIDPTWGNTTGGVDYFSKLDFNHIAFVIRGLSSDKPYPAGTYKIQGKEEKDVEIAIASAPQPQDMSVALRVNTAAQTKLGLSTKAELEVTNTTGQAWYDIPVEISLPPGLALTKETQKRIPALLPFQTLRVPVAVESSAIFSSGKGVVTLAVGDQFTSYETSAGKRTLPVALGAGALIFALITGSVLVRRARR